MSDWNAVLSSRGFWMTYEEWGNPDADVKRLVSGDPVLRITLPARYVLSIDGKVLGAETFALTHSSCPAPIELGWFGGNFALPALRWEEVQLVEQCLRSSWNEKFDYVYLPLLLNRMAAWITETDAPHFVSWKFWSDWAQARVFSAREIADLCMGNPEGEFPVMRGVRWRCDDDLGWVCEGENSYSLRHPDNDAFQFKEIADFFQVVKEHGHG